MLHDSLTGLVNHSRLQQQLEIETARALRQHQVLSLAMIDIDHFKEVNDRHGHQTGDRMLKNLARFLRQRLRASDVIGRYGGEEFAVILADTTGEIAEEVINSLRRDFAAIPHETGGDVMTVTFSAGIASLPEHASVRELDPGCGPGALQGEGFRQEPGDAQRRGMTPPRYFQNCHQDVLPSATLVPG